MKILFIGGTGNISTAVSKLALERGIKLYLLHRGTRKVEIPGAHSIIGDISQPEQVTKLLEGLGHESRDQPGIVCRNRRQAGRDSKLETDIYVFLMRSRHSSALVLCTFASLREN